MLFNKKNKKQNINKPGEHSLNLNFLNRETESQKRFKIKQALKKTFNCQSEKT